MNIVAYNYVCSTDLETVKRLIDIIEPPVVYVNGIYTNVLAIW